jgi:hypothetical protein
MFTTSRNIYDVLYEAGEPLDAETIAARTWDRATSAAQGHAMRAIQAERETHIRSKAKKRGERDIAHIPLPVTPRDAWGRWMRRLLKDRKWSTTLLLTDDGKYYPNPEKPPVAERPDGTKFHYTREAWIAESQTDRVIAETHTMGMEADRLLGQLSREELLETLELFVVDLAGGHHPIHPRTLRKRLRWLLERPTTDESRAWLLHELTRRIYEEEKYT